VRAIIAAMRLARKLTLALVFAVCAVLTAHGVLTARRELAFFEADTQRDARVMGRTLVAVVSEIWRAQGEARALQTIDEANEREATVNFRYVSLDPSSPRKPTVAAERIGEFVRGRETVFRELQSEGRIFTYVPIPADASGRGAIEVSSSLVEQHNYVRRSIRSNAITTAATTLVAAAVTILLGAYFVGRPMRELIAKARRIGAGDLTQPLALRQRDELGELAGEINSMCDRLDDERTARMRAVDELRHAHRLAVVGRLAAGVAHELGTPLHVVKGWGEMIAKREVEGDAAVDAANNVVDAASRMTRIIRALLDFARRGAVRKEPESIENIVRQVTTLLTPIAEKRGVEIIVQPPEAELVTEVDAGQLQQAITNLAMNGIDAMSTGGRLVITVASVVARPPRELGGPPIACVSIAVRDDGPGIEPSAIEQLFEPFFTTKGAGEGTGLGLSVSYGIVQEHGGWIAVESLPGHGACFTVFLPMRAET
jgi:two-component system NtrC family sensor kinase